MPRRSMPTRNGLARPTNAQYKVLMYWAGNIVNHHGPDARVRYVETRMPAPQVQTSTDNLLHQRGWWRFVAGHGYIVTDPGRTAVGLPPAHRDHPCPLPGCHAEPGERCVDFTGPYPYPLPRYGSPDIVDRWPYTAAVHDARLHRVLFHRIRKAYPMAPLRAVEQMMRDELAGSDAASVEAVARGVQEGLALLRDDPYMHVGLAAAT